MSDLGIVSLLTFAVVGLTLIAVAATVRKLARSRRSMDGVLVLFWLSSPAVFVLNLFVHGRTHGPNGLPVSGSEPPEELSVRVLVGLISLIVVPTCLFTGSYLWYAVTKFVYARRLWNWVIACICFHVLGATITYLFVRDDWETQDQPLG